MPQDNLFPRQGFIEREDLKAFLVRRIARVGWICPHLLQRYTLLRERSRLLYFGNATDCDERGLYRYPVDPHALVTQIMADPNRNRANRGGGQGSDQIRNGFHWRDKKIEGL